MATKVPPDEAFPKPPGTKPADAPEPETQESLLQKEMAEFEVFGPETETRIFQNGLSVTVGPFTVGQVRAVMPHLTKLMEPLAAMFKTGQFNITELQETDWDGLIAVVSISTGLTPEQVSKLVLEDFVWVVVKIVTVNSDFFARALPKLLGGAAVVLGAIARKMQDLGR